MELAADHHEPQEAWPLDISLQGRGLAIAQHFTPLHLKDFMRWLTWALMSGDCLKSLRVRGAADSPACLGDVQLGSITSTEGALCLHHIVCRSLSIDSWLQVHSRLLLTLASEWHGRWRALACMEDTTCLLFFFLWSQDGLGCVLEDCQVRDACALCNLSLAWRLDLLIAFRSEVP